MNVFYNGISFSLVKVYDFTQEAIYSDDGMDYLYTRCRIDCQGILNPKAMAYVNEAGALVPTDGTPPATTAAAIRGRLLFPRGTLILDDVGDQQLVASPVPGEFSTDVKGGPFPRSCNVTAFEGSQTFFIRYVIETFILECPDSADSPPLILSNRWSSHCHINQDQLPTVTFSGQVVFNRAVAEAAIDDGEFENLDNAKLRTFILPAVHDSSQRVSIDIIQDSAGNSIAWRATDEGRMISLGETDPIQGGSGILRIAGSHGVASMSLESGAPASGASMFTFNVKAWGVFFANQWRMIQRCFEIITTLIDIGNPLNLAFVTQHAQVTSGIDQAEQWVEVSLSVRQLPNPGQALIMNLRVDTLRVDQFDLFRALTPEPGGGVGNPGIRDNNFGCPSLPALVVQKLSFGVPCVPVEAPDDGDEQPDASPPPSYGTPAVKVGSVDVLPPYTPRYGPPPTSTSMYTDYSVSLKFDYDSGVIQCPISGVPQSPGSSGSSGGGGGSSYNGPSSLLFQVSMPMAELVAEGTAECAGAPPMMPSINPTDQNLALKRPVIDCQSPVIANDGITPVYRVSFSYRYFFLNAFDVTNPTLAMGALPWTSLAFTDNILTPDMFGPGIISDPSGGPVAAVPQNGSQTGPSQ